MGQLQKLFLGKGVFHAKGELQKPTHGYPKIKLLGSLQAGRRIWLLRQCKLLQRISSLA